MGVSVAAQCLKCSSFRLNERLDRGSNPANFVLIHCHLTDRYGDISPIVKVILSANLHAGKTFEHLREVQKNIRPEKEMKS
jgi:hypothetical protein